MVPETNILAEFILRPGSHETRYSNYCSESYYKIFSITTLDYFKNYLGSSGVTPGGGGGTCI